MLLTVIVFICQCDTDVSLMVCGIVSLGEWSMMVWRIVVPLSSRTISRSAWTDCVIRSKPPAQQNCITSQITCIFCCATVRSSNPTWYDAALYFREALCCWWLRRLTLPVFHRDLLSTRENLDARSQHDNSTSKCGRCCYRQSAVCSRRIFRYGDKFGTVGGVGWGVQNWCRCHWKWRLVLYNVLYLFHTLF